MIRNLTFLRRNDLYNNSECLLLYISIILNDQLARL